jgi:hypothetical protein
LVQRIGEQVTVMAQRLKIAWIIAATISARPDVVDFTGDGRVILAQACLA